MPPGPPEAAEIAHCLCLQQALAARDADRSQKDAALGELRAELGRIDDQLQRERSTMDVNNEAAVARYRQLLERRDSVFRRSTGAALTEAGAATQRYNAFVNDYNAQCANRPRDPRLLADVQAHLVCPPPY
jgi:hypothetical protein